MTCIPRVAGTNRGHARARAFDLLAAANPGKDIILDESPLRATTRSDTINRMQVSLRAYKARIPGLTGEVRVDQDTATIQLIVRVTPTPPALTTEQITQQVNQFVALNTAPKKRRKRASSKFGERNKHFIERLIEADGRMVTLTCSPKTQPGVKDTIVAKQKSLLGVAKYHGYKVKTRIAVTDNFVRLDGRFVGRIAK